MNGRPAVRQFPPSSSPRSCRRRSAIACRPRLGVALAWHHLPLAPVSPGDELAASVTVTAKYPRQHRRARLQRSQAERRADARRATSVTSRRSPGSRCRTSSTFRGDGRAPSRPAFDRLLAAAKAAPRPPPPPWFQPATNPHSSARGDRTAWEAGLIDSGAVVGTRARIENAPPRSISTFPPLPIVGVAATIRRRHSIAMVHGAACAR